MKHIKILIMLILTLFLVSCTSESIIKYQCDNGQIVDSIQLCEEQKCPITIETKTIEKVMTKYQCYDGTIKDESTECSKTNFELPQDDCPNLEQINVFEWSSIFGSKYMRLNNSFNGEIIEEYEVYWDLYVQCEKGNKEGDNINYYYCGKYGDSLMDTIHLKKELIDKEGVIREIINKKAYLVVDNNFKYIKTICY